MAVTASWTPLGTRIDSYVYDWMFRLYRPEPWQTESIVLAIDEHSLSAYRRLGMRKALADGLGRIAAASPKAVAVDAILADDTADGTSDDALEAAFKATHNLILPRQRRCGAGVSAGESCRA
jgi:CHASE2 domain-containing sensor protein